MPTNKSSYTLTEAAKKLKISRQAVLLAIKQGKIKGRLVTVRIPTRTWRISVKGVESYKVSASHKKRGLKRS